MNEDQERKIRERREYLIDLWRRRGEAVAGELTDAQTEELLVSEHEILGADYPLAKRIAEQVMKWRHGKPRNSAYVGYAVQICADHGIEVGPTLAAEAAEVVRKQAFEGLEPGSAAKFERADAKQWAFQQLCLLKIAGASIREAASQTAALLNHRSGGRIAIKASVLEKQYAEEWRYARRGIDAEEELREALEKSPAARERWRSAVATLPLAPDSLKGNRRE